MPQCPCKEIVEQKGISVGLEVREFVEQNVTVYKDPSSEILD